MCIQYGNSRTRRLGSIPIVQRGLAQTDRSFQNRRPLRVHVDRRLPVQCGRETDPDVVRVVRIGST